MSLTHAPCRRCRRTFHLDDLDAKPRHRQFREMSADFGQLHALDIAAERGWDFDILECEPCYGPGWVQGTAVRYLESLGQ